MIHDTRSPSAASARRLRIVIADDNEDGRDMLSFLLAGYGHEVATAEDGERALEVVTAFEPDLVILDIGMPGLSGYDTARRLREVQGAARPLLVALSGFGRPEDKAQAAAAGFDHHLTKPVDIDTLLALIAERAHQT